MDIVVILISSRT